MAKRVFSAEEAYAIICSDTESASEGEEDFVIMSSESSDSDTEPEPPRQRRRGAAPSLTEIEWVAADDFCPQVPEFTASPGLQFDPTGFTPIDFFSLYFSEDLINIMVSQTNLYASQFIANNPEAHYSKGHWTPTCPAELRKFWGLFLNFGLVKKPSIRDYWSQNILHNTPLYRSIMSRNRF